MVWEYIVGGVIFIGMWVLLAISWAMWMEVMKRRLKKKKDQVP